MIIERVVLAREVTRGEIEKIKEKVDVEIETFIHGAMCISCSDRCVLSNHMTDFSIDQESIDEICKAAQRSLTTVF